MLARILPLVLALAPLAAFSETSYSRAAIVGPRLNVCDVRQQDRLFDRKAALDLDQQAIGRERDAIERESLQLQDELRALDNSNTAAVAAYNAHSNTHNDRVAMHNRYVAAANHAAALLNGDSADFMRYCDTLRYSEH
jgi:D-serine deaminase-like pyridoxal phosphate-dependent protein